MVINQLVILCNNSKKYMEYMVIMVYILKILLVICLDILMGFIPYFYLIVISYYLYKL